MGEFVKLILGRSALTVGVLTAALLIRAEGPPPSVRERPDTSAVIKKAKLLQKNRNYMDAVQLLFHALAYYPDDEILKALLRSSFSSYLEEEISSGNAILKEDPANVEAYLRVAKAFQLVGQRFRALETLTEGITNNPDAVVLWMAIGNLEMGAQRDAEALSVFNEIIRIDTTQGRAHHNVAYLLSKSQVPNVRNLKLAFQHAQLAVSIEPENPEYIDILAQVRFQMGERHEAISLIKKAIKLAPDDSYLQTELQRFQNDAPGDPDKSVEGRAD